MTKAFQPKFSRCLSGMPPAVLFVLAIVAPLAALQQEPYTVGEDGVTAPRLVAKVDPDYTQEARDARIQGTVVLAVVIGRSGRPEQITVTQSLDLGLDLNAVGAVRQWEFEPGMKDGEPVAVRTKIEVTFHLR